MHHYWCTYGSGNCIPAPFMWFGVQASMSIVVNIPSDSMSILKDLLMKRAALYVRLPVVPMTKSRLIFCSLNQAIAEGIEGATKLACSISATRSSAKTTSTAAVPGITSLSTPTVRAAVVSFARMRRSNSSKSSRR